MLYIDGLGSGYAALLGWLLEILACTKLTDKLDLSNIPDEVREAKIVNVAAGYDHIVALDENGKLYVWGNTRLKQDSFPNDIAMANSYGKNLHFKQIEASSQFSAAVTEDGGEENFWHIMTFPYEGAKYAALVPEDQIDEEEPEVIFVKIAKDEQGDAYIPVENEVLLEELFEVFAELLDDEPEEPENDAWV